MTGTNNAEIRAARIAAICLFLVAFGFGLFLTLRHDPDWGGPALAIFLMTAGALGGALDLTIRANELITGHRKWDLIVNVVWKILASMIFAILVYITFAAELIQGSLFPMFTTSKEGYTNMRGLMDTLKPATQCDAAKAIVWAFIAGYSERFVPTILGGLQKSGNSGPDQGSTAESAKTE